MEITMPGGRPKKNIDLDQLYELAKVGLSQRQIAASLGISLSTITERMKSSPEFRDTMERAQQKGISTVVNRLYESATDPDKPNTQAAVFFLKNRSRSEWADRHDIHADVQGNMTLDHDLDAALQRLRDAGIDPRSL
jgi:predicted amino acid racemase